MTEDQDDSTTNHGVLKEEVIKAEDWSAGDLDYEIVVPDGDHTPFVPTNEPQSSIPRQTTERYNCVTQAHHNVIETIMNRDIQLGRMPAAHLRWLTANGYVDANGKVNFSEQFNSIRNGTVWNDPDGNNGNSMGHVAEDGRKTSGLIPATMLPDVPQMPNVEYYDPSCITPEMVAMGQEFLKRFKLPYGWVSHEETDVVVKRDDAIYHLKQGPLMTRKPGHLISGVKDKNSSYIIIQDSYSPFIKDLAYSKVTHTMKVLVGYLPVEETETMVGYKKTGDPTTYVAVGNTLVPIADWKAFTGLGGSSESVIELSEAQFAKFPVASSVLFKSASS